MRFTFEGNEYRLAFRHDKPRDLANHIRHKVELRRQNPASLLSQIVAGQIIRASDRTGPVELWCMSCDLKLAPLTRQDARNCHCALFQRSDQYTAWELLAQGHGRLNTKAGDTYNRSVGRKAAERDLLVKLARLGLLDALRAMRFQKRAAWEASRKAMGA